MRTKTVTSSYDIVERVSNADGTSTALTQFGATAGKRNLIEAIFVMNTNASGGYIDLRDGVAGAVFATIPCPASSGGVVPLGKSIRQPTANTALAFDVSAALANVILTFCGSKGP